MQLPAGHSAFDGGTLGALIGEKIAAGKRILPRLHMHVDAAGGEQSHRQ
jgi:hypothetical protein